MKLSASDGDRLLAVEGAIALSRLGLQTLADVTIASLYQESLLTVGSECSRDQWNAIRESVSLFPREVLERLFKRNISTNDRENVDQSNDTLDQITSTMTSALPCEQLNQTKHVRCVEMLMERLHSLFSSALLDSLLKRELDAYQRTSSREMRLLPLYGVQLRSWRRGIHSVSDGYQDSSELLRETLALQNLVPKFQRRLCCYAHQYLESDENQNLIPASVYHMR